MTVEERTLVANLVPEIDMEVWKGILGGLRTDMESTLNIALTDNTQGAGNVTNGISEEVAEVLYEVADELSDISDTLSDVEDEVSEDTGNIIENLSGGEGDGDSDSGIIGKFGKNLQDKFSKAMEKGPIVAILQVIMAIMNYIFEFVQGMWARLKKASPFLNNIVGMITSVFDLILGPIGTAIGIELIPLLVDLYDSVMEIVREMWDAYENEGLSGMIRVAINGVLDILIEFIPYLISIGLYIAKEIVQGLVQALMGNSIFGKIGDFVSSLTGGTMASKGTMLSMFAEGGEVEPTPGGTPIIVGEAGEREYIVPESKKLDFSRSTISNASTGNTYNIYVTGYTDEDLADKIVSVIDMRSGRSDLYGGFRWA